MCFSPEVDLIAGVAVTGMGIDALRHVDQPNERLLASLPVVFGTHLVVEAVVWWGADGTVPEAVGDAAAWLYLAVAFALVPWFVPLAIRALEPHRIRRGLMGDLAMIGAVIGAVLMYGVIRGPVLVTDAGRYLDYDVPLPIGGYLVAGYVLATCGALLISSDRRMVLFGRVNLAAVVALAALLSSGLISLWCVWAAITSGVVVGLLRGAHADDHAPHRAVPAT